ncbi:gamma-glutamyltransferase [Shimia marina]|uniref:Glutathione hydrolase proenzyme n=1 Tax=Shimia marina TaxID=321267 RepID=A0A0P1ETT7_9RHOB|nr:gamma-glutamyltransferase [Shimia marina]CUH54029.1 Gamma-glutamyltranspeptidase precursor [Shimia marina]SFE16439.1 gamma-glutamyltranspeptidase / glutathione hydrolase [Shimia marina]
MNRFFSCVSLACLLATGALAQDAADSVAPEVGSELGGFVPDRLKAAQASKDAGTPTQAERWMVAAAHPLAVDAGADVLRAGGTAADAMVAVQTVLGLVEPQSSGLGGGAFLVWYDAESGAVTTLDGREKAPLAATPKLFLDDNGARMKFFDAVVGGRSVGVPGTPMLLEEAHRRWGRSAWPGLLDAAIGHAETGFAVSPRLAGAVAKDAERLSSHPATAAYFLPGGAPLAEGSVLQNPEYAESLRLMAEYGADPFYTGEIATDIVATVRNADNPGVLTNVDMAFYQVQERDAVCVEYRDHDVCGMGPPSSGGLTVGQILGLVAPYDLAGMGPESAEVWRLIGDASRLAFADRGRYMADSDFVPVPTEGLIAPEYLAQRAKLLSGEKALESVAPGTPEFDHALLWGDGQSFAQPSTSHISIVDSYGNALSMTTTIENGFGSRVMARGFLLNNELTDFSFRSHNDGVPVANRVEPGKRPRSSMAPTIVLKDGVPSLVIGSPGGSRIIGYVAKTIIAHLDWGLDVQAAIDLPHLVNRFGTYDVESGTGAVALAGPLSEMGFEMNERDLNSGLHAISLGTALQGGADKRREGLAYGE